MHDGSLLDRGDLLSVLGRFSAHAQDIGLCQSRLQRDSACSAHKRCALASLNLQRVSNHLYQSIYEKTGFCRESCGDHGQFSLVFLSWGFNIWSHIPRLPVFNQGGGYSGPPRAQWIGADVSQACAHCFGGFQTYVVRCPFLTQLSG